MKIFVLNYIIGNDLIYLKVNGINDNYYYYLEVVGNNMIENILCELIMNNLRWFIWICIKWNNKFGIIFNVFYNGLFIWGELEVFWSIF